MYNFIISSYYFFSPKKLRGPEGGPERGPEGEVQVLSTPHKGQVRDTFEIGNSL